MLVAVEMRRWTMCCVSDVWNMHLPYLYSCISLLGVVMLLSESALHCPPLVVSIVTLISRFGLGVMMIVVENFCLYLKRNNEVL